MVGYQYLWTGIHNYVEVKNNGTGGDLFLLLCTQVSSRLGRSSLKVSKFKYFLTDKRRESHGFARRRFFVTTLQFFRCAQITNKNP
jgi:hypothetical protein